MFSTQRTTATLAHFNPYSEKHGEDSVSGMALKLVMMLPCAVLDGFRPKLTETFFRLDKKDIEVKFPEIEEIRWAREIVGAKVLIGYEDLFDSAPIELNAATVDHFRFGPKNGGSVEVTVRVKCKPEGAAVGRLFEWLNKEVLLTIEPPALTIDVAAQKDDLVSRAEGDGKKPRKALDGTK